MASYLRSPVGFLMSNGHGGLGFCTSARVRVKRLVRWGKSPCQTLSGGAKPPTMASSSFIALFNKKRAKIRLRWVGVLCIGGQVVYCCV